MKADRDQKGLGELSTLLNRLLDLPEVRVKFSKIEDLFETEGLVFEADVKYLVIFKFTRFVINSYHQGRISPYSHETGIMTRTWTG